MPETVTGDGLRKNVFFKMSQNSQETPVPEEFCKIFKNTFFTEQFWTTASEMRIWQQRSERFCCRELDAMLISSAKIPKREESISPSSFMGICPLVTRISLIYLRDEFWFWFLVQLNETRRLGEYKLLSFCFCVNQVE